MKKFFTSLMFLLTLLIFVGCEKARPFVKIKEKEDIISKIGHIGLITSLTIIMQLGMLMVINYLS